MGYIPHFRLSKILKFLRLNLRLRSILEIMGFLSRMVIRINRWVGMLWGPKGETSKMGGWIMGSNRTKPRPKNSTIRPKPTKLPKPPSKIQIKISPKPTSSPNNNTNQKFQNPKISKAQHSKRELRKNIKMAQFITEKRKMASGTDMASSHMPMGAFMRENGNLGPWTDLGNSTTRPAK